MKSVPISSNHQTFKTSTPLGHPSGLASPAKVFEVCHFTTVQTIIQAYEAVARGWAPGCPTLTLIVLNPN